MTNRTDRRLRILVVSQYYPPERHGALPASLARELARRGHQVEVVTTFPNHPAGHVFDGWEQRLRHLERDGAVRVQRVPMVPDHSNRAWRRVLAYGSFAVAVMLATRSARHADVVYVYGAQPTAAIAPVLWRRFLGRPFVLHVQDIWPDSVLTSGMVRNGLLSRALRVVLLGWLATLYRSAGAVIAIAPGAARLLVERGSLPETTSWRLNWTTTPAGVGRTPSRTGTTLVYAGNLGPAQGLDAVVRAFARCADLRDLRFVLVGDGLERDRLRALAVDLGTSGIEFRPPVARERIAQVHAMADFEVVALDRSPMSEVTVPSKLQDALAHGVPVIGVVPGDAADVIHAAQAGFTAGPGDVDAIEAALRAAHGTPPAARAELGRRARAYADEQMSLERATDHIETTLREAAA